MSSSTAAVLSWVRQALPIPEEPTPGAFRRRYEEWVVENVRNVRTLENYLRLFIFAIPGRYRDSEFRSETFNTAVNLLSFYHDCILVAAAKRRVSSSDNPTGGGVLDIVRREYTTPDQFRTRAALLTVVKFIEVWLEMGGYALFGFGGKYAAILTVECTKAFIRLMLLKINGGRVLVHQTVPPVGRNLPPPGRTRDPLAVKTQPPPQLATLTTFDSTIGDVGRLSRESLLLRAHRRRMEDKRVNAPTNALPGWAETHQEDIAAAEAAALATSQSNAGLEAENASVSAMEEGNASTASATNNNTTTAADGAIVPAADPELSAPPTEPTTRRLVGELLYIIRPVAYALSLWRTRDYPNSWKPWLLSLALEIASRLCSGPTDQLNKLERLEVDRRSANWIFYFLRAPFYEKFTKARLVAFLEFLGRFPLLSFMSVNAADLAQNLRRHYFYTSAS